MGKKYKLRTDLTKEVDGTTLYRIEALKDFGNVKAGELGGYIEKEENLSQGGKAWVCGNAMVEKTLDYYVSKNIWSSGRYFTYTRSNRMWRAGCFYGTGEELIAKAYKDSKVSGREYKRIVEYVEAMYNDLENDKQQ